MTQFKKSFKGMAAALSMATLSLLSTGCDNDNRSPVRKKFDEQVLQVINNPKRAFSDEMNDKCKGERAVNINRLFESSEWIIETVQKNPKKFIRDAVKEALYVGWQQGRLIGSVSDKEFLINYTPTPDREHNVDTDQWIHFFRDAAQEAAAIRAEGADKKGVIPRTWTGKVMRRDVHGIWRETESLSPYAKQKLAEHNQQEQLINRSLDYGR